MKKMTLVAISLVAIAFGASMAATAGAKDPNTLGSKGNGTVQVPAGEALPYLFTLDKSRTFMPEAPGGRSGSGLALPALLVFGKGGCLIGLYGTGATEEVGKVGCKDGTSYGALPRFLKPVVDPVEGGVVMLVGKAGGVECKTCQDLESRAKIYLGKRSGNMRVRRIDVIMK